MGRKAKFNRHHIAEIAVEALELDLPLVSTLAVVLDTDQNQARLALRAAQRGGFIGAGTHQPTKAQIHRNTSREQSFLVCEHCLQHWPCTTVKKSANRERR